jgi:hypothetical protein
VPWFPDFVSAMELARKQTRAAGQAHPVAQYLTAHPRGGRELADWYAGYADWYARYMVAEQAGTERPT